MEWQSKGAMEVVSWEQFSEHDSVMQVQQQLHSHLGVVGACRKALGSLLEGVAPEADRLKVVGDGRLP